MKPQLSRRYVILGLLLVVLSGASVAVAQVSGGPDKTRYGAWAPGVSARVSALDRLPPVMHAPPMVLFGLERASAATGGDPIAARATLRRLRSGLGASAAETIYAFSPGEDAVCMIFWPRAGGCPTAHSSDHPGLIFRFTPGGPGYSGLPSDAPPAIAGVVADNIGSVALVSNGERTTLPIVNNAFFGELERPPAETTWIIDLEIKYASGQVKTVRIPDPRAGR